ncbi:MAG TPA: Uma2 family endonuclease [Pyrinomonadaceae bacterium]|jgi:Uma2 family endonuclease
MVIQIARRAFNVTEYYRMIEAGILSEQDRVELLDGEIIEMSPIGSRHAACVDRLNHVLNRLVGQDVIVRVQNPIRLDNFSEPQPDIALLRSRPDFYAQAHPTPEDVLLVVEVADTSAEFDRAVKFPLYAEALIQEAWLVNLQDESIEIFSHPAEGAYKQSQVRRRGENAVSPTVQNLALLVDDILT